MRLLSYCIAGLFLILNVSALKAGEPIKVAAVFAKSGKAALGNTTALEGIRFAVEEINEQGGLLGEKIRLLEFDNKSTALGSKIAARKAVAAGVITVFGASWSSHSMAMAPVLQKAEIPMISPYSTHAGLTLIGDYIFRICFSDPFQGKILASFVFQDLQANTAAVLINANSKYSESLSHSFIKAYLQQGGRILLERNYLQQTADFTDILNAIKQVQPKVVFLPGHIKTSGFIIKQARINGIRTTFAGGDGWNDSIYKSVGNVVEGSYFSNHWHQDGFGHKNQEFVEKYRKRSRSFDAGNALSEDCVYLFADAVQRAGSFDPKKIRKAIAETRNFQGVTGDISFDKNGDPIKSAVILKFEKGKSVYVKTVNP